MGRQVLNSWLAAFGVVALLISGCGGSDDGTASASDVVAEETVASEADTVATVETTEEGADGGLTGDDVAEAAAEQRDPAAPIAADAAYRADATPLLTWFSPFEPGNHRTGALGTPLSFVSSESLNTQLNGDGMFVISDISSRAPDDRDLVFIRVGAFSDPEAPNTPIETQTPWPNDDLLGWLENLTDDIIATDPIDTNVNGLAAVRVDLRISDEVECGWMPGHCVGFITNNGHDIKGLNKGASYRVWIVEQGEEDPLAIVDGIARDEDAAWHLRSDAVLETIGFGDIAPNPVQWLDPGPTSLDAFGGVEVTLPDDIAELTNQRPRFVHRWNGRGLGVIPITDQPAVIYFADRPHDVDGRPLSTADELVSELVSAGMEVVELEATTVDGVDTRVFDVAGTDVGAIVLRFSPLDVEVENFGWDTPVEGRIWLIEHPDRGLLMVSTHAFDDVDEVLPGANELAGAIISSMSFSPGD